MADTTLSTQVLYFNNLSFTLPAACTAEDNFITLPLDILQKLKDRGLPNLEGLTFPTHQVNMTLADPKTDTYEVIWIYAYQGNQVYAQRGGEGTAQAWPAGTAMYQALTARDLELLNRQFELLLDKTGGYRPYAPVEETTLDLKKYSNMICVIEWQIPGGDAASIYGADMTIDQFVASFWHTLVIVLVNTGGARQLKFNGDGSAQVLFAPNSGVSMVNSTPTLPLETDGVYRITLDNVANGRVAIGIDRLEQPVSPA